jgi:putative ABC transport system substrate-binding protein
LVIVSINETSAKVGLPYLDEPAQKMGFRLVRSDVSGAEDLEKLLAEKWSSIDAVFPMPSVLVGKNIHGLIAKAKKEHLPLIVYEESWVQAGALASFGPDHRLLGAQAAKLVVKVLKGIKPADIPIETPDPLVLTINRSAAKAMGLKIRDKILERADRIFD